MILDFPEQLAYLQKLAPAESVERVLSDMASIDFLRALDELILAAHRSRTCLLGWLLPPTVAARFDVPGDPWMRVRAYCKGHFGEALELIVAPHLVEALVALFQPPDCGVWIGDDALTDREPSLQFDKERPAGRLAGAAVHEGRNSYRPSLALLRWPSRSGGERRLRRAAVGGR